jgi:hypothetical protein
MARMRHGPLLGIAVLAFAAPSAAHAAAVTISDPCPRLEGQSPVVAVDASGFAPGEQVAFSYDNFATTALTAPADSSGELATGVPGPALPRNRHFGTFTLSAKGLTSGTTAASAAFPVVTPWVSLPSGGRPTTRVLYRVYGFPNGRPVYAHYTLHGKQRAVKRLGTAAAPCGTLKKRLPLLPAKFHTGRWVYHFNNSKRNRNALPLFEVVYRFGL